MIKQVSFENFKGQTGTQELTGKDIFIGRNGSGKTTRIQAIGGSMLGYIPGNGKTAQDTFKLATGTEMTIGMKLDGFEFSRTFEKQEKYDKKSGTTSTSITESVVVLPGQGEANDTQKKTRIKNEIGDFPVMLDFNNFLELSDAKRRDFIYSLSPIKSDTWNRERIHSYLGDKLLTLGLKVNNQDHFYVMHELIEEVMGKYPENYSVSAGLQAMIDWVTVQLSAANSKKKDSQGAVRQISDLKNEQEETDRNIAAQKKELEELQNQLVQLSGQIAGDREKQKAILDRQNRIRELQDKIAELKNAPVETDTTELEKQLAELTGQLQPAINAQELNQPLKEQVTKNNTELDELRNKRDAVQQKITSCQAVIDSLKGAIKATGDLKGRCVIHHMIACPKDFTGLDEFITKKEEEANKVIGDLRTEKESFVSQIKALEDDNQTLLDTQQSILFKAESVSTKNNELNNKILSVKTQISERQTALENRNKKIADLEKELTELLNKPAEPIGEIEIMEKQVEGIQTRITELKDSVERKEKAKQTILLLNQSMLENKKAELRAICLKSISDELGPKGIQGELVKEILDPIKTDIQGNLKLMGFDFEPFFQTESDTGKEIFQFGWINEKGHQVNFDAMSTGQQTVFLAAMMMTIIDRANPKLRLLVMDNLNHLDRQNFQMLINGLSQLAPKLDNIILAGAIEFPFTAEGWQVWNLSEMVDVDYKVA